MLSKEKLFSIIIDDLREVVFNENRICFLLCDETDKYGLVIDYGNHVEWSRFTINSDMLTVTHARPVLSLMILLDSLLVGMDAGSDLGDALKTLPLSVMMSHVLANARKKGLKFCFMLPPSMYDPITGSSDFEQDQQLLSVAIFDPSEEAKRLNYQQPFDPSLN